MDRRNFFRGALSLAAIPAGLAWVSSLTASDAANTSGGKPDSDVPLVASKFLRRLPNLPGRLHVACFSPDARKLAVVCAGAEKWEVTVNVIDTEGGLDYERLVRLPHVRTAYSISWEANGKRLVLSTWEFDEGAPRPFQTRIHVLDAVTGEQLSNQELWTERAPIDKKGVRTPVAWLDSETLLATQEGAREIFSIDLKKPKLVSIYKHAETPPETDVYTLRPNTVADGQAAVIFLKTRGAEFPPLKEVEGAERHKPLSVIISNGGRDNSSKSLSLFTPAVSNMFCDYFVGSEYYYCGFSDPQTVEGAPGMGEFVRLSDGRPAAMIPVQSPFTAEKYNRSIRIAQCLSMSGTSLVIHEIDVELDPDVEQPRIDDRAPHGRLTVVELRDLLSQPSK